MHAISSYRGNRPTNTHPQTNPRTGPITIHCAAASTQCNEEITNLLLAIIHINCRHLVLESIVKLTMSNRDGLAPLPLGAVYVLQSAPVSELVGEYR